MPCFEVRQRPKDFLRRFPPVSEKLSLFLAHAILRVVSRCESVRSSLCSRRDSISEILVNYIRGSQDIIKHFSIVMGRRLVSFLFYDDDGSTYYVVSEKKVYEMCKILRISYLKQEPVVKIIACLNLPVRERSTK